VVEVKENYFKTNYKPVGLLLECLHHDLLYN